MGCCCSHVTREGVVQERRIRWGFVWTWPWWLHHALWLWKMTLERLKAHKSRYRQPLRTTLKDGPLSEKAYIFQKKSTVYTTFTFNPFATIKRPDKGPNQTMLWVEFEVHMFFISAHSHTVPALPSLTVPELFHVNVFPNKRHQSLYLKHYACVLSAYRAQF